MRAPQELQATVTAEAVKIQDERLILQAQICLELPMPAHDADLPRHLEAGIERVGQVLKRRLFRHAIEQADAELLVARRHGKQGQGIICRGTRPKPNTDTVGEFPSGLICRNLGGMGTLGERIRDSR